MSVNDYELGYHHKLSVSFSEYVLEFKNNNKFNNNNFEKFDSRIWIHFYHISISYINNLYLLPVKCKLNQNQTKKLNQHSREKKILYRICGMMHTLQMI